MFYMEFIFVKREDKMKTKINHAWVLTMNQEFQMYRDGYVVIEDQKIVETGDGEGPSAGHDQHAQPYLNDSVSLDGR